MVVLITAAVRPAIHSLATKENLIPNYIFLSETLRLLNRREGWSIYLGNGAQWLWVCISMFMKVNNKMIEQRKQQPTWPAFQDPQRHRHWTERRSTQPTAPQPPANYQTAQSFVKVCTRPCWFSSIAAVVVIVVCTGGRRREREREREKGLNRVEEWMTRGAKKEVSTRLLSNFRSPHSLALLLSMLLFHGFADLFFTKPTSVLPELLVTCLLTRTLLWAVLSSILFNVLDS